MKGDQAYTCNSQSLVTIFSGWYLILRFTLCRHMYNLTILHVLRINKYIILWCVSSKM